MNATRSHIIFSAAIGLLIPSTFAQDHEKPGDPASASAPARAPAPAAATAPAAPAPRSTAPFGYYSTAGRIYRIENGRATPVQTEQTMRISPKGITGFDGRTLTIPEGQMIGADGRLAPLPKGITGLPAAGGTLSGTALSIDQGKPVPNTTGANPTLTLDTPAGAGPTGATPGTKAPDIGVVPNPPLPTGTATPGPAGPGEPTTEATNGPAGTNPGTPGSAPEKEASGAAAPTAAPAGTTGGAKEK